MSRQLDQQREERAERRHKQLIKAIEYGLVDELRSQDLALVGLAIKYTDFHCLLTIKVEINETRLVSFVGGDSIAGCLIAAYERCMQESLRWKEDQYYKNGS